MLTTDLSEGHVTLVTGATGGIGQATCVTLASSLRCAIAVHYHSASDDAAQLVKQLHKKGVRAQSFQADLSSYDQVCAIRVVPRNHIMRVLHNTRPGTFET